MRTRRFRRSLAWIVHPLRQTMKATRLYIDSLDGIRALSFLIVFVSHAGLGHIVPGGLGVTVFFFLSGYLITTLLRQELEGGGRIDLKQFYLRRVLRIFPPFYVALLLATLLSAIGALPGGFTLPALASQLFYANNYYMVVNPTSANFPAGTGIYWSLAVEEHFYAVFPFALWLLWRNVPRASDRALWLAGACGLVLAWRCVLVLALFAPEVRTYVATDTRIDSILYGCILALWNNPALDPAPTHPQAARRAGALAALGGLGMLVSLAVRSPEFRETARYSLQGLSLLPLFYAAVRYPQWPIFRLLNAKPVRFVGLLSYSLYLVHFIVLALLERYLGPRLSGVREIAALQGLGLALSLGLAYLMHVGVERPAARLKSRLSR